MARIVIEEPCRDHGRFEPHYFPGEFKCRGASRRVLDLDESITVVGPEGLSATFSAAQLLDALAGDDS